MAAAAEKDRSVPIAIIGLSCRLPGEAATPSRFWDLLKNGRSGYSETNTRFNAEAFVHPQIEGPRQNVIPTKGGYILKEDPYVFDAAFFNITATEATAFDPRQRITMEVAYEALENAGMKLQDVAGSQTSCFMGTSMSDYRDSVSRDFQNFPKYHMLGVSDEMIANRVSHFLDIHGPSATVQSACSSSLVATHIACQSLRTGESSMAIAGGVGLILGTEGTMHLTNLGFLNPTGHSRSFDADAGGYGRGEGCGVLIMKRLDDALRDGDNVRAVIRATGVNSDGWTQGVTFPSFDAQAALIRQVYEANGLDYGATQYVEAHGTGTKAGDPVETRAISSTIGQSKTRKQLYIGSVKPNIGHLEAAAGVASIIKGTLALEHGMIPPNINFSKPNPNIPFHEWKMVVPTKLTPWPAAQTKRLSISGFGMGGTNGHVVMDAYKAPSALTNGVSLGARSNTKRLFVFSSHDKAGFQRIGASLAEHIDSLGAGASSPAYLANLAHTLAKGRSGHAWRASLLAETVTELREQLTSGLGEDAARAPTSPPRLGFVFTGQGAQWAHMGLELLDRPVFAASVAKSAQFLKELGADWDVVAELSKQQKESKLGMPKLSQPICSVLQIALVDELESWGVTPSKVCGHSSGEIAAAYTVGALSHRDAIAAAYFRGVHGSGPKMQKFNGGMMAVGCSREAAEAMMKETKLKATVACVNSPSSVTISGDVPILDALREKFDEQSIFARRLKVDVAYHSGQMHVCSMDYYSDIAEVGAPQDEEDSGKLSVTMVSSVTGAEVDVDDLGPYYWVQNLISPVLFLDAVKELVAPVEGDGEKTIDLLIELGPHTALGGPIEQILAEYGIENVNYTSMLTRGTSAIDTSLALAAELFTQGLSFDVAKANGDSGCKLLVDLPPYAWNHSEQFRADGRLQREQYAQQFPTKSLLGAMQPTMNESERVWRSFLRLNDEPWLRGHVVGGTVLFPGAGMVSVVLEAAQQLVDARKTPRSFKLRDINFLAAMALPEDQATEITVHLRPHLLATSGSAPASWYEFTVSSCVGPTGVLRDNCRGLISVAYEEGRSAAMDKEDSRLQSAIIADYRRVLKDCPNPAHKDYYYSRFRETSMQYGGIWQGVENCHPGQGKTVYDVRVHDIGDTFTKGKLERPFLIHAAALDAAWQGYMGSTCNSAQHGEFGVGKPMVPVSIGELEVLVDIPAEIDYLMPGVCRSHKHGFNELSADINLFDKELSRVVLSTVDYRLSPLEVEDVDEGGPTVDIAEITSDVRWDYSLDLLTPSEISQVVAGSGAKSSAAGLKQLVQMAIHQRPSLNVIELVQSPTELTNTVMSTLASGAILPAQLRYALVDASSDDATSQNETIFGSSFALGAPDAPMPENTITADLIVVPHTVSSSVKNGLDGILDRLLRMAKPGAVAAIAAPFTGSIEEIIKTKGFELLSSSSAGTESLAFFRHTGSSQDKPSETTNGTHSATVTVLEAPTPSSESKAFARALQDLLKAQGYTVQVNTGFASADAVSDQLYISLLELEQPVLEDLSKPDYLSFQKIIVGCKRLVWITSGDNPSMGMIDGLVNCCNAESGEPKLQVLHLTREGTKNGPSLAMRILGSAETTNENEFREQAGLLQVPRLYKGVAENEYIRNHLEDQTQTMSLNDEGGAPFHLTIGKPGMLDTLRFVRDDILMDRPLADDEMDIQVKATGVNFRDIMACMELVSSTGLGVEASGVVLRVGKRAAKSFKTGDRVTALSLGGAHATRTRCDARVSAKLPTAMSFEEGAAAATVYATAYYALVKLAKLRPGQSVLIHAAAGGVGQAALQLAKHFSLVAYVTVGTEDKRQLLIERYGVDPEHIFHSRDSSFAKGIARVTRGRGVDCVLNSLSGELLRVSWTCLATFGTFVEIGTRDITDNMRLDMRPFSKSATFTSFDIPTSIEGNPAALGEALNAAFRLIGAGQLRVPHPLTVYPAGEAQSAFRTMQQGRHRGKIVLSFSEKDKAAAPVLCRAKDALKLDPKATYLFVGGLGGLGRSLAKEFVASGARHLAFMSRSGDAKQEAKTTVEELRALGAKVRVFRGDVADQTSFLAAMEQCAQQLPPIKGVVQMAMVLRDGPFENMTYEDWTVPVRPKVQGTWNLHQYFSADKPLDFMIFCSSLSGLCGSPGQAQYGAGNTYQDSLAHFRRARGVKAVSVNLGLMLDVGILAEMGDHSYKQWEAVLGIRETAFHALMKSIINGQQGRRRDQVPAQIATGFGTADLVAAHRLPNPPWLADVRFSPLAVTSVMSSAGSGDASGAGASLAARLAECAPTKDFAAAGARVTTALMEKLAEILRIPVSEIDAGRPLYSYGVDSLVALEVRNWVTREAKASVALLDILAATPIEVFGLQIAQKSKVMVE